MFVSPRSKVEEEFKVPKSIRTQSFKEEQNSVVMHKMMSHPNNANGQELIMQPERQLGQIMSGGGVLMQS